MKVGDVVEAIKTITEDNFPKHGQHHTHAKLGDLGDVRGVDGEWVTVTWRRSTTTTDCHPSEISTAIHAAKARC